MKWKQFLTPVRSMNSVEAARFIDDRPLESVTILDVRQPREYREGHIPGAILIPLPELRDRMNELDPSRPTVVYCAVGGRSRVGAQMLKGAGFSEVYNMSGGFKAWQDRTAVGEEDNGLDLFEDTGNIEEVLLVAYGLEKGLRQLYLTLADRINNDAVTRLFTLLADIEERHQERIFAEYCRLLDRPPSRTGFDEKIVPSSMEGGMTTERFLVAGDISYESPQQVLELAMVIEAQALDMYSRASRTAPDDAGRDFLVSMAREEQAHLRRLGALLETTRPSG